MAASTLAPVHGRVTAPKSGARRPAALAALSYLAIAAVAYLPAWVDGPGHTIQYCGCSDEAQNVWFLQWGAFALAHLHNPLFAHWGNHPGGVNIMSNTAVPLLALLGAPVTWVLGAVTTYNVLLCLAFAASAFAAYALIRRWTSSAAAAWVGGLLYGFSPYVVAQDVGGHLNLAFVPIPPLVLLVLDELLVRQTRRPGRWGALLGLLLAAELGISAELVATMGIVAIIGMLLLALLHPQQVRSRLPGAVAALAAAAAVFLVLGAYPLWMMLAGPQHTVGSPQGVFALKYRADLLGALLPTTNQLFRYGWLSTDHANLYAATPVENGSFLGLPLIVMLVAVALAYRRRAVVVFFALMAAITFVLSLGVRLTVDTRASSLPLPYSVIAKIPLADAALASRFSLYVTLFAAVLLGVGIDTFVGSAFFRRSIGTAALSVAVLVAALLPLAPAFPSTGLAPTLVPPYFTSGSVRAIPSQSVVLSYPSGTPISNYMELWQAESGMRFVTTGGYFIVPEGPARTPVFFDSNLTSEVLQSVFLGAVPPETPVLRRQLLGQWRLWGVRTVLFAPLGKDPAQARQFMEWLIGRPPDATTGGITAWYRLFAARR